jgi:hypothetical protein
MNFDEIQDRIAERQHEFGGDTASDRAWKNFVNQVELIMQIDNLDGDQAADGYSLDFAYDLFVDGLTPREAADELLFIMHDPNRGGWGQQ